MMVFLFLLFSLVGKTLCGELTPKEILQRADKARGNLSGVRWKVHIVSIENESPQELTLDVKARGYDFLSASTSPPNMKGQKLLMIDRNMWFMKTGLKKPVPISPRQKLIGGASNGDIAATNYANEYEATPMADQVINDEACFVFDLKAIDKKATYDRIIYWISKERGVGVKAEFYTVSGKMFKSAVFEFKNQVQIGNKRNPFISKMVITDAIISKNITTLNFSDPNLVKIPPSTFDLNFLITN